MVISMSAIPSWLYAKKQLLSKHKKYYKVAQRDLKQAHTNFISHLHEKGKHYLKKTTNQIILILKMARYYSSPKYKRTCTKNIG